MITDVVELDVFEEWLTKPGKLVVLVTSPKTCVPCRQYAPVFEEVSENIEAHFVKVDIDKANPALVAEFNSLSSVPTTYVYDDGVLINEFVGFRRHEQLENAI